MIKIINQIKANALQNRLIQKFREDNDDVFKRLVLHTEVKLVSKYDCLYDSISFFLNYRRTTSRKLYPFPKLYPYGKYNLTTISMS